MNKNKANKCYSLLFSQIVKKQKIRNFFFFLTLNLVLFTNPIEETLMAVSNDMILEIQM